MRYSSKKEENDLDWTDTLEIKYKSKEEKENNLLSDFVLSLDANPFDQPSMNTIEFNVINKIDKHNNNLKKDEANKKIIELNSLFKGNKLSINKYFYKKSKVIKK